MTGGSQYPWLLVVKNVAPSGLKEKRFCVMAFFNFYSYILPPILLLLNLYILIIYALLKRPMKLTVGLDPFCP